MTPPVLYSFRRCPYAMRARLALAASGQRCELREVELKRKPPEMLAASPKGTVPVLVLADGTVIDQSLDIMRWALAAHDPLRWLQPGDTEALVAACDDHFKPQLDRYKYPGRFADAVQAEAREQGARFLRELEARLAASAFLLGADASLADAALMPFVRQYAMVEPAWFEAQPWPRLRAWLADWIASPLFDSVMRKNPPWRSGEAGIAFP